MNMQEAMTKFVEAEEMYLDAKRDLQVALSENMPNPFMKIDFAAVKREVNHMKNTI